ncbi:unnamed protein product [Allacma fusca]|uniref:Uncharacterized protein n=1 Tax=Allacma fusca TaxID=39272 RepID=A0A8J2J9K2_9HEXA|nr:unnamed protein product [Allacma fusca]
MDTRQVQLISQVQNKLQELRDQGCVTCVFELFRPRLTQFYSKTTEPDQVAVCLVQLGVLTLGQQEQIRSKVLNTDKNEMIYSTIFKKESISEIIQALASTGNDFGKTQSEFENMKLWQVRTGLEIEFGK